MIKSIWNLKSRIWNLGSKRSVLTFVLVTLVLGSVVYADGTLRIVPLVRDYMWRFGVQSHRLPGDVLLNELKASGTLWVYGCTRDLVQHVGIVSSGLGPGGTVFRSRTFDRAWGPVHRREWATA